MITRYEAMQDYLAKVVCGNGCHCGTMPNTESRSPCTGCLSGWDNHVEVAQDLLRMFPALVKMDPELCGPFVGPWRMK